MQEHMADEDQQVEQQSTRAKRRLRAPTETVRERNQRIITTEDAKSAKQTLGGSSTVPAAFWWGFTWPIRQLGKGLRRLGQLKFFRVLGRILFPRYFRNSWRELRLVTWPSRITSWKLTYAVIIFSVLFGAIVALVDFCLDKLFKEFIIK